MSITINHNKLSFPLEFVSSIRITRMFGLFFFSPLKIHSRGIRLPLTLSVSVTLILFHTLFRSKLFIKTLSLSYTHLSLPFTYKNDSFIGTCPVY